MILTVRPCPSMAGGRQMVAIFGVGLVGGAILRALRRNETEPPVTLPVNWRDQGQRMVDLSRLTKAVTVPPHPAGAIRRLDIVWAAGKAGFGARREELDPEIHAFRDIVAWSRALCPVLPGTRIVFHMLSSAGGLFEGQRFIDDASQPSPRRPYGEAKFEQEKLVEELRNEMIAHIYRPSSIYGFSAAGGRSGLFNTLIANAKKHTTSRIFGGLDTLRDYVLSTDVGEFITGRIERPEAQSRSFILASGKPTSVTEMLQIASKVIGRPLYLMLEVQPSNASHITYRTSALPDDWRTTDLETGIRLVARQLSISFEAGAKNHRTDQRWTAITEV